MLATECTKPSHSQSLPNFVANIHSQGISAARTKMCHISFAKPFAFASEFFRIRPIFAAFCLRFGAYVQFASEFSGRVRIRIRIRSRIAATAVLYVGWQGANLPPLCHVQEALEPNSQLEHHSKTTATGHNFGRKRSKLHPPRSPGGVACACPFPKDPFSVLKTHTLRLFSGYSLEITSQG